MLTLFIFTKRFIRTLLYYVVNWNLIFKREGLVYIYYSEKHANLGDILNGYLLEKMGYDYRVVDPRYFFRKHLLMIGSVIQDANRASVILGSGLISDTMSNSSILSDVVFVRGDLTANSILNNAKMRVSSLTDPAWLLPVYYQPVITKSGKTGIIPHYVDRHLIPEWMIEMESFKIIDIQTNDIESTLDEIISCDRIVSSSLHGLILADAYKIPNCWVQLSSKVQGEGFKFKDYFSTVGRTDLVTIIDGQFSQEQFDSLTYALGSYERQEELHGLIKQTIENEFIDSRS